MKRLVAVFAAAVVLILGILPFHSEAAGSYVTMKTSQNMLDIIKDCEGFSAEPYWDVSQWSIGYGTVCGYKSDGSDVPSSYWNGITEEKGQELLMAYLANSAEAEVNAFFKRIGRQPSQQQFDAITDFTYALGSSWMYEDSKVQQYLKNPTDEIELMRVLGAWCRVNGAVSSATCNRRIREALVYLYGYYSLPHGTVSSNLPVVADGNLPSFKYVIYNGNGVGISPSGYEDTVDYFFAGTDRKYGTLLTPTRAGYTFYGWYESAKGNPDDPVLISADSVTENMRVYARWAQLPFRDMPNSDWASTAIAYCWKNGYMLGTSSSTFSPEREIDRGMMVTVLYRLAGEPKMSGSSGFPDVRANAYYADAVTWAKNKGLVVGYSDGTFRPEQPITRQEMVKILYLYAENIAKLDVSGRSSLSAYSDVNEVSGYAEEPFRWALYTTLINGTSATTLSPKAYATRAQLAKELMILANLD